MIDALRQSLLMFRKKNERAYRLQRNQENLSYWRKAMGVFAILFAAFSLLDILFVRDHVVFFHLLRFGIVIPALLVTILLTYAKNFPRYADWVLSADFFLSGAAIALMIVYAPLEAMYVGGLFLVLFSGFFLLRIYFWNATIVTILIVTFQTVFYTLVVGFTWTAFSMLMFFLATIVIGIIGSYFLELVNRQDYQKERRIAIDRDNLAERVGKQLEELHHAQTSTIVALAELVVSRDPTTGKHIDKVTHCARELAAALPESAFFAETIPRKAFIRIIEHASALHDIGKVGIPDPILNKPGPLTKEEFEVVKTHVRIGHKTLEAIREKYPDNHFINMGTDIALYHHERYDGTGYPEGLKKEEIPLSARIMALVDVYDALTSKRPYKRAYSHKGAVRIICEESPGHFDPLVIEAFRRCEKRWREEADIPLTGREPS